MPLINHSLNGRLNLDTHPYRIQNGDHIDALNITRDSPGDGQDILVSNLIGNEAVPFYLPPGDNKVIGKYADRIRNRVYIFIWNSNNTDLIVYYNRDTNYVQPLIENILDTRGEDVLDFDPSFKINHIDIIYNDTYGDLLSWTDGKNVPRKINVSHILNGDYSTIKASFIQVAKAPPQTPVTCAYGTDSTRNSNALRSKLFMFAYRWQYDDFEKSSVSTYSKIPLPVGFYGSDNDTDSTKNNFITLTVDTGEENVIGIEILMRYNIADAWSDFVQVIHLDKSQLSIADNSTYQYLFYNDNIYPPVTDGIQYVDGVQVIPLFDWVPQLAYNQCLANGSNLVYGAIQEGYNNYPTGQLQVSITAANETNSPPDTDPPAITYTQIGGPSSAIFVFTVSGSVPVGTRYRIYIFFNGNPSIGQTYGVRLVGDYTSIGGDTVDSVAFALYSQFNAYASVPSIIGSYGGTNFWQSNFNFSGAGPQTIIVTPGSSGGGSISTEKTWLWDATYIFGIVYVDDQNRDMPGVTTFTNPTNSDNDFSVTTPSFSQSSGTPQTPVISASISHLPPAGAVKYYWVRRRQTYGNFLQYETCDFQDGTATDPNDQSLYFCLANIEKYKAKNDQFIYGTAPISSTSRIQIMAGISSSAYTSDVWTTNNDYQILGLVTRTLTGGTSHDDDRLFIKVAKPAAAISPAYSANMLVMVYTPMLNPTSAADAVYWEWGEAYDIYEDGGIHYHRGMDQDQTASQPATFTWEEGDVYFHDRTMYQAADSSSTTTDTVALMDANWSDFFDSAVNDNGRAQVIEVNARQQYNPVLIRFGGTYQQDTTINETNKFLFEDFQEADRTFGDIRKFFIRDRYLYVFQKYKIGIIPVLLQIVQDTEGNPLQANSNELLNKINYPYNEDIGIGDIPESFASDKYAMYGADDYKSVVWRLSQDGVIPLSVVYECNSFFSQRLPNFRKSLNNGIPALGTSYKGDPSVYGVFDAFTNKYIIALEEINRYDSDNNLTFHQDPFTLTFNEVSGTRGGQDVSLNMEGFESFTSFYPDMMVCLDVLLMSFKNGSIWKHTTNAPRCAYYNVQYNASITPVFNANALEKKTWMSLNELSNEIWECPVITTSMPSYGSSVQESLLIPQDFRQLEGQYSASFKRATNSNGSTANGSSLKGSYIIIKFLKQNPRDLTYLNGISILFKDSALTPK